MRAIIAMVMVMLAASADPASADPAYADPAYAAQPRADESFRVGILYDAPWQRETEFLDTLLAETQLLLGNQLDVVAPNALRRRGDGTAASVRRGAAALTGDTQLDLVLAAGPLAVHALRTLEDPPATLAVLPTTEARTAQHGALHPRLDLTAAVEQLRELTSANRIAVVAPSSLAARWRRASVLAANDKSGAQPKLLTAREDPAATLAAIRNTDAQGVIVAPMLTWDAAAMRAFAEGLIEAQLPALSLLGSPDVEAGILLGSRELVAPQALPEALASAIERLSGEAGVDLSRQPERSREPALNPVTAERLGLDLPAATRVATHARSAPGVAASRRLSLVEAIATAVEANLGLRADAAALRAGAETPAQTRAALRPQLDLDIEERKIDADRARAGNGRAPEYRGGAGLSVSQVLYSEARVARLEIERALHQARSARQTGRVLDVVRAAGVAYLDLLRAETLARIRRDDLSLTMSNYERAQARLELGAASRSEVLRWETERARTQAELQHAEARVQRARVELNRLMSRPLGDRYRTVDPTLADPYFLISDRAVLEQLSEPAGQALLQRFFMREAADHAPALTALRERLSARRRALRSAQRAYTRPEVVASAAVDQKLHEAGDGTEQLDIDFGRIFPDIGGSNTRVGGDTDRTEWRVGIRASLPLYQGGERGATARKRRAELDAVQLRYDEALLDLRARVLNRAHAAEASFASIEYARAAARAGRDNLDLVTEAYDRGVVSVIDLLDAQSAALSSELSAANAVFNFLIDWLELQRASGRFDVTATRAELKARRRQLEAFIDSHG